MISVSWIILYSIDHDLYKLLTSEVTGKEYDRAEKGSCHHIDGKNVQGHG